MHWNFKLKLKKSIYKVSHLDKYNEGLPLSGASIISIPGEPGPNDAARIFIIWKRQASDPNPSPRTKCPTEPDIPNLSVPRCVGIDSKVETTFARAHKLNILTIS